MASSAPVWGHNVARPAAPRIRPRDAPSQMAVPDFFLPPSPPVRGFTDFGSEHHARDEDKVPVQMSRSLSMSYSSQRADLARFRMQYGGPVDSRPPPARLGRGGPVQPKTPEFIMASSPTIMSVLQQPGSLSGLPRYPTQHRFSDLTPSSRNPSSMFPQDNRRGSDDLQTPSDTEVGSPDDGLQFTISMGDDLEDNELARDLDNLTMLY